MFSAFGQRASFSLSFVTGLLKINYQSKVAVAKHLERNNVSAGFSRCKWHSACRAPGKCVFHNEQLGEIFCNPCSTFPSTKTNAPVRTLGLRRCCLLGGVESRGFGGSEVLWGCRVAASFANSGPAAIPQRGWR